MEPRKQNLGQNSFVARDKIILTPVHIKLGIMKQFVKSLDKEYFFYIWQILPQLTMEKSEFLMASNKTTYERYSI